MERHRALDVGFFWAALAISTCGGFALGAYLIWQMGLHGSLPADLSIWVQVHGHLQLVGWAGLFIMGVSLFFLPRFAATPLTRPRWVPRILGCTVGGLLLEAVARLVGPRVMGSSAVPGWLQAVGGSLTGLGIVLYVLVLIETFWKQRRKRNSAIRQVEPFLVLMLTGWVFYAIVHGVLTIIAGVHGLTQLSIAWHRWTVDAFAMLVLFPVAYAFSVRTFPLYLQTPLVRPDLHRWGIGYALMTAFVLITASPPVLALGTITFRVWETARLMWDGAVLALVWELQVLVQTRPSWRPADTPGSPHPHTGQMPRRGYSDYGEFGRFEWLLYSAYGWLVGAVFLDGWDVLASWFHFPTAYGRDPVRHAFLVGFITLLILGMAQRMLPGFMHRKRLAHPGLVGVTALLGNAAAFSRVFPLLTPGLLPHRWPDTVLALSGWLAIGAVVLLAWNLVATRRWEGERIARSHSRSR